MSPHPRNCAKRLALWGPISGRVHSYQSTAHVVATTGEAEDLAIVDLPLKNQKQAKLGSTATSSRLLRENGGAGTQNTGVRLAASGVEAPPSGAIGSPETYVGYRRADSFASAEKLQPDRRASYTAPGRPALNQWGLAGSWIVGGEAAVLAESREKIVFRFHSRDLHVVLGPSASGTPVRFTVSLDGKAPGIDHGVDSAPDGSGVVREPRLYQLIRQTGPTHDRTFEIEFLDAGAQAYVFTFG